MERRPIKGRLQMDSMEIADSQMETKSLTHHAQTDLNKKSSAMHQTLISFIIDPQGFRKTKNENTPTWEIGVTS